MSLIEWQPRLSVGVAEFDEDHQTLIRLINQLWDANQERRTTVLGGILEELARYVSYHFRREEDLFANWGFPGAADHHRSHQRLEEQVAELGERYRREPVIANDVFEFLRDWLIRHILGDDMVYASYFRALGVTSMTVRAAPGQRPGGAAPLALPLSWTALGLAGAGAAMLGALSGGPWAGVAGATASALGIGGLVWTMWRGVAAPVAGLNEAMRQLAVRRWDAAAALRPAGLLAGPAFYARVIGGLLQDLVGKSSQGEEILREAEKETKQTLLSMSDQLERAIDGTVTEVSGRSDQLGVIARTMLEQATSVSERNRAVAQAAGGATRNVNSVAASAGELLASLRQMADETAESQRIAERAAAESRQTTTIVAGLSEASRQIGDIVGLIDTIARQTNLLALNATIEAARAGDAGKGFAVVAGEVKGLAQQTTDATSRIRGLVDSIQVAVAQAAEAIGRVDGVVERINAMSAGMAATIRRQAENAGTISDEARQAANETRTVTATIAQISETATEAEQLSSIVMQTVGSVSAEVDTLRHRLVATLRQSFAGNRRRHERISVSTGAILSADGSRQAGRIRDMSISGALVEVQTGLAVGAAVRFVADGFADEIPARVVRVSEKGCHLEFRAAEGMNRGIADWLSLISPADEDPPPRNAHLGDNVELF